MARFYGSVQGHRAAGLPGGVEATRCGVAGIDGHVRGWDIGVRVRMEIGEDDQDAALVYLTMGSNAPEGSEKVLFRCALDENIGITIKPSDWLREAITSVCLDDPERVIAIDYLSEEDE